MAKKIMDNTIAENVIVPMANIKLNFDQTVLAAENKAQELADRLGKEVFPMVYVVDEDTNDYCVGFLEKPNRMTQMRAIDQSVQSSMTAGMQLLMACLLKTESDYRLLNDAPQFDDINLGAFIEAFKLVQISVNAIKKN